MKDSPDFYTVRTLAEYLRVHTLTIWRLVNQGKLPGFRIGSLWRFRRDVIEEWIKERMI